MNTYVVLLRGINVGGKNKMPMAQLKTCLEEIGCKNVLTYIQSGNVLLQSELSSQALTQEIEAILPKKFELDTSIIKVLILTETELQAIVDKRPKGFGDHPETYHSDAIFLMGISSDAAFKLFSPREGVDKVWQGDGVIYSQRVSELRTKSRLAKIIGTPEYKSMTIRSWATTIKLLALLKTLDKQI